MGQVVGNIEQLPQSGNPSEPGERGAEHRRFKYGFSRLLFFNTVPHVPYELIPLLCVFPMCTGLTTIVTFIVQ